MEGGVVLGHQEARGDEENNNYPNPLKKQTALSYLWNCARRRHRRRSLQRSWLAPVFAAVNVVIFAVTMYVNDCPSHHGSTHACVCSFLGRFSFEPLSDNPYLGPSRSTLLQMGAQSWEMIVHNHQVWRLLTSNWLHNSVTHLASNMLALLLFGIGLEKQFGQVRMGFIYLISGFGSSVFSCLFMHDDISVGASGSIYGLLGAMLSELLMNWTLYTYRIVAVCVVVNLIVTTIVITMRDPNTDSYAHIGGALTGFLLGFVLLVLPYFGWFISHNLPSVFVDVGHDVKSKYLTYQYVLWVTSLVLLIVGYIVSLVMLFGGVV